MKIFSFRNIAFFTLSLFVGAISYALTCQQVIQKQRTLLEKPLADSRVEYKVIGNPKMALAAMVKMIRDAKVSLDFSTFIIRSDNAGRVVMGELFAAAQRGVKIRILVDSVGSMNAAHGEMRTLLKNKNVELVTFNSLTKWSRYPKTFVLWLLDTFSFGLFNIDRSQDKLFHNRMHDKIVVADLGLPSMTVMVGGRNASDHYFGVGQSENSSLTFLDMNVLIRPKEPNSEFSQNLNDYFESLYYHQTNQLITQKKFDLFNSDEKVQARIKKAIEDNTWLEEALKWMEESRYLKSDLESGTLKLVHELQNITQSKNLFNFKTYNWKGNVNSNSVIKSLREAFHKAKKKIRIVTPYLILSKKDIEQLEQSLLLNPKLEVEFLTNSMKSNNHTASQLILETVILPELQKLMDKPEIGSRLKVWLFSPHMMSSTRSEKIEGRLHAKLVEVDGDYLVTSSNFDLISRYSNSEMGFWIRPDTSRPDLAKSIQRIEEASVLYGSAEWKISEANPQNQTWVALKKYLGAFINSFHVGLLRVF